MKIQFILYIILTGFIITQAQAFPVKPEDLDGEMDSLFTSGNFEELELLTLRELHNSNNNVDRLVAAHLFLGFVRELTNKPEAAQKEFLTVLSINPELELNPVYVPPRISIAFDTARAIFIETKEGEPDTIKTMRDNISTYQMGSSIANLIIPGTGFYMEEKKVRGLFWMTLESASIAAFWQSTIKLKDARSQYLQVTDPNDIDGAYDRYNRIFKETMAWGASALLVYLGAQVDFQIASRSIKVEMGTLDVSSSTVPMVNCSLYFNP